MSCDGLLGDVHGLLVDTECLLADLLAGTDQWDAACSRFRRLRVRHHRIACMLRMAGPVPAPHLADYLARIMHRVSFSLSRLVFACSPGSDMPTNTLTSLANTADGFPTRLPRSTRVLLSVLRMGTFRPAPLWLASPALRPVPPCAQGRSP